MTESGGDFQRRTFPTAAKIAARFLHLLSKLGPNCSPHNFRTTRGEYGALAIDRKS
jgi:hypothetical protein